MSSTVQGPHWGLIIKLSFVNEAWSSLLSVMNISMMSDSNCDWVWPCLKPCHMLLLFAFGSCPYDMVRGYDTCGSWFLSGPMIWFSQVINLFCLAFPNKRLPSAYLSPHSSPLTTTPLCLCSCHSGPHIAHVCYCLLLCAACVWFCHILCHWLPLCAIVC